MILKAFSACSPTHGCWETKKQGGSSRAQWWDRPRPVSPLNLCPTKQVQLLSPSARSQDPQISLRTPSHSSASKHLSVLRPAMDLKSKLAMLAPLLHPEDAGLVLCLAERGSETAKPVRRAHAPSQKCMSAPTALILGTRAEPSHNSLCHGSDRPDHSVLHSRSSHNKPGKGGPCQGHSDLLTKAARLLHIPPCTWGFAAVTQKSCKQMNTVSKNAALAPGQPPHSHFSYFFAVVSQDLEEPVQDFWQVIQEVDVRHRL